MHLVTAGEQHLNNTVLQAVQAWDAGQHSAGYLNQAATLNSSQGYAGGGPAESPLESCSLVLRGPQASLLATSLSPTETFSPSPGQQQVFVRSLSLRIFALNENSFKFFK